jgi:peptidyl-prolyl cis-trans isomerase C
MSGNWTAGLIVLLMCSMFLTGCKRHAEPEDYIARVNDEYLTLDMISRRLDEPLGMNEIIVREYVNQWLTSEILYQEARRRGLDRDDRVLKPLQDIRRNLAINALLEDEIYTDLSPYISDEQVEAYYESHKDEFTADAPIVDISYVLFDQRNVATSFRNTVIQGAEWEAALDNVLNSENQSASVVEIGERGYYRERDIHPPEIWRAARQLGVGGVSFPVSTTRGFYIVRHHGTIQSGSTYPIDYVSNEIRERLVIEKHQERYEQLLLTLRQRYPIDVTFEMPLFEDTLQ